MKTAKTWNELLGRPQTGTVYGVQGCDIVATEDGEHWRRIWTFDSPAHAEDVYVHWVKDATDDVDDPLGYINGGGGL